MGGFASGFAHLHCWRHAREQRFEDHVADVCTRAASRVYEHGKPAATPEP